MKSISIKDLLLAEPLAKLNQFDVLHPDNDYLVNPVLHQMGFDLSRGLEYTVSYHRRLNKEDCVGFVITGEVRTDREFLSSPWCSAEDRMIAAGRVDSSLALELAKMMNVQIDYGSRFALEDEEQKELWQENSEIERIEDELLALGVVLDNIRGNQLRRDGSRKRPQDYHVEEAYEKPRKKKDNRSTLRHREAKREQI